MGSFFSSPTLSPWERGAGARVVARRMTSRRERLRPLLLVMPCPSPPPLSQREAKTAAGPHNQKWLHSSPSMVTAMTMGAVSSGPLTSSIRAMGSGRWGLMAR